MSNSTESDVIAQVQFGAQTNFSLIIDKNQHMHLTFNSILV